MKIKTLVLVLAMLGLASRSIAGSPVHFGLEGGLTISNMSGLDAGTLADTWKTHLGFATGFFLQVDFNPSFAVVLEALYTQKGSEAVSMTQALTYDLSYVEVPLLLKLSIPTPGIKPFLFGGGAVSFNILAQSVQNGNASELANINRTDIGVIGGVGLDIDKFTVHVRYQLGLMDISDTTRIQNGTILVMTGYSFM